jgi:hypothetical protein
VEDRLTVGGYRKDQISMSDSTARLDRLEANMDSVKTALARLEPMIIRIDERMTEMVTKAELDAIQLQFERRSNEQERRFEDRFDRIETQLARKPSTGTLRAIGIALYGILLTSLSVGSFLVPIALTRFGVI